MQHTQCKRFLTIVLMAVATLSVNAQNTMSVDQYRRSSYDRQVKINPYSVNYRSTEPRAYGTFFAEYNPFTWSYDDGVTSDSESNYHGISLGFNYFIPFGSPLGIDAGAKLQYLFRRKTELGVKNDFEMLALTVPVSLATDIAFSEAFALHPYVGLYGRYAFLAKTKTGADDRRYTEDWTKSDHPHGGMSRLMTGWQVGANCRFSNMISLGVAYWMDFAKMTDYDKLRGFNITLGVIF